MKPDQLKRDPQDELLLELAPELGPNAEKIVQSGRTLPMVPTRQETLQLLQAADGQRDRLLMRLLYATGIWLEEAANLRGVDVAEDGAVAVHPGQREPRMVLADSQTVALIGEWRKAKGLKEGDLLFEGAPINELHEAVVRWGTQVGLVKTFEAMQRRFTAQSLRHAFGSRCIEGGMDVFVLKRLMGHEFLTTTEMYPATASRRREYEKYHPLCRPQK